MRRSAVFFAGVVAIAAIALPPAEAASTRRCGDVRIDQELHRTADGDFGAFNIHARKTTCRRARRFAARYVHNPSLPTRVGPWRCSKRTIDSQVVRVSCRLNDSRVFFRDIVPNG
jgi:hypothetical protein